MKVANVVRVQGVSSTSEHISDLVWAMCPIASYWWPAEKLDPFNMPPGRELPTDALLDLKPHERKYWLPSEISAGSMFSNDSEGFESTAEQENLEGEELGEPVCVYSQEVPVEYSGGNHFIIDIVCMVYVFTHTPVVVTGHGLQLQVTLLLRFLGIKSSL